ncbi:DUF6787 family protein [Flavobacterium sp.]|jgi:hypothetical protein|uniref:DUF6787 family protein n=1 Tax=Flavobacterium sp. TaxID=239 RepID=UPI00333FE852
MASFKERYHINSNWQYAVILLVFALTGSTAAYLAKPLLAWVGITRETVSVWLYYIIYFVGIFPVYQVLLVGYGFLFGQFKFFWTFEKKMLRGMKLGFLVDFFEKK